MKKIYLLLFSSLLILTACSSGGTGTKEDAEASVSAKESSQKTTAVTATENTEQSSTLYQETTAESTDISEENTSVSTVNESSAADTISSEDTAVSPYYDAIKSAWQKQLDYINSLSDPKVKQSVQTPESAATFEANSLVMEHPSDKDSINEELQKVLTGE